ncbi:MAG: gliding motility-associated C-terminal domain-containing protein [Cytophagaceae bacterium]
MTKKYCISTAVFSFCFFILINTHSQDLHHDHRHEHGMEHEMSLTLLAEELWSLLDIELISSSVFENSKVSQKEQNLFFRYANDFWMLERINFFIRVRRGEINHANLQQYGEELKFRYIEKYPEFLKVKDQFAKEIEAVDNKVQVVNGPCVNMGFEEGTFNGWEGAIQTRNTGNRNGPVVPGPFVNGFSQHCIMTRTMRDPMIPNLPVVAPGGNFSVRLGNTVAGGHLARIRQTFRVDSSNMIFTYRYAVVLEDPVGSSGHEGMDRPHFMAKLYDQNGNQISCAGYSVVVNSNLDGFTRICVDVNDQTTINNIGCPPNDLNNARATSAPTAAGCGNNRLDIYYREWTTVSVALNDYYMQNVTIEFVAADCVPSGHLGYAYVDAECLPLSFSNIGPICSGREQKTLTAPAGFERYAWIGPAGGIVSGANTNTVTINRSGTYRVTLTPFSDTPCPVTLTYNVSEYCPPVNFTASLCETVPGSGIASGVNLNNYTNIVTQNGSYGTLTSWHNAQPVSNANRISSANNVSIPNGGKIFALVTNGSSNQTVELTFTINPKPIINFPDVANRCERTAAFQIAGVTPAGGAFSGINVTSSGSFNPASAGAFPIQYRVQNNFGCADSITKTITVDRIPTANAGPDQVICSNSTNVILRGTINNASASSWSGGNGQYQPAASALNITYIPSQQEVNTGTVTLRLTTSGSGSCPAATDDVVISITKMPEVNAGPDQRLCENVNSVSLAGTSVNSGSLLWSGGAGSFLNSSAGNATYSPTNNEKTNGQVTLTFTANGNTPCPSVTDQVVIFFSKEAGVNAGADQRLCSDVNTVTLSGTANSTTGLVWTGGSGLFSDASSATAIYTPSQAEKDNGQVILRLSAQATDPCPAVFDEVQIQFDRILTVSAGDDQFLCASTQNVSLSGTATNHGQILWSGGSGSFSSANNTSTIYQPTQSEIQNGSITLTLTAVSSGTCPSLSDEVEIKYTAVPEVNAGPDKLVCANNQETTISATSANTASVIWSGGHGVFTPDRSSLNITYIPSDSEIQSGAVNLILSSSGNVICPEVSDQMTINIKPAPEVNSGPDLIICEDVKAISLQGTGQHYDNVSWSGGNGGNFSNAANIKTDYSISGNDISAGQISFVVTAHSAGCHPVSDEAFLKIVPLPVFDLSDHTACTGTSTYLGVNAANGNSYQWLKEGIAISSSSNLNVEVSLGQEIYKLIVTNADNCTYSDSSVVTGIPVPVVGLNDASVCPGENALLQVQLPNQADFGTYPLSFEWLRDGKKLSNQSSQLSTKEHGVYVVFVSVGGCTGSATGKVVINPLPVSSLLPSYSFCSDNNNTITLDAGPAHKYLWLPSDTSRILTVNAAGTYEVILTNEFGCSKDFRTSVRNVCPPQLHLSNAFSPNKDNTNDFYNVYGEHIGKFRMLIFNRWGEIIFESQDLEHAWDGNYREEPMPIGVYPWIITYEGDTPEYKGPYKKEGSVTVVK